MRFFWRQDWARIWAADEYYQVLLLVNLMMYLEKIKAIKK